MRRSMLHSKQVLADRSQDIRVVYFPYALEYHRFALPAARASDCANEAHAFERWTDVIFQKQDSLGLKSWGSCAMEAGIADTAWIASCALRPGESERVKAGRDFGDKIGLTGTPAILVNGWYLKSTPNRVELNRVIESVLDGDPPQGADQSTT